MAFLFIVSWSLESYKKNMRVMQPILIIETKRCTNLTSRELILIMCKAEIRLISVHAKIILMYYS